MLITLLLTTPSPIRSSIEPDTISTPGLIGITLFALGIIVQFMTLSAFRKAGYGKHLNEGEAKSQSYSLFADPETPRRFKLSCALSFELMMMGCLFIAWHLILVRNYVAFLPLVFAMLFQYYSFGVLRKR